MLRFYLKGHIFYDPITAVQYLMDLPSEKLKAWSLLEATFV